jgi:hypothetical protein
VMSSLKRQKHQILTSNDVEFMWVEEEKASTSLHFTLASLRCHRGRLFFMYSALSSVFFYDLLLIPMLVSYASRR